MAAAEVLHVRSPDGTRIGCEVVGDGPPLLAVHGSTADRHRWAAVRDALAERFRLHLMDRRGRGLSAEEAPGPYTLEREAQDVAAVLAEIGPGTRVLAHSYGATCALEAVAGGASAGRIVLYEPAFAAGGEPVFPLGALAEVDAALERGDREAAVTIFFRRVLLLGEDAVGAVRATPMWQARLAAAHTLGREARAANAYAARPERLAAIGAPVRFLLGTETTTALRSATLAARAALPESDLVELAGHGHSAMDADPALFAEVCAEWLRAD
jgi:pimeloyl-ACP methyl ester carboxylesterase